MYDLPALSRFW